MFGKKKSIERLTKSFGQIKNEEYYFNTIDLYFRKKDNANEFQVISDKTYNDLDFDELFMFLDRTYSKIGQQHLYNKLRVIPQNEEKNESKERIINEFISNSELRLYCQLLLDKLNKLDACYICSLFQNELLPPPKWFALIRVLSFTNIIALFLLPFYPQIFLLILGVTIVNLIIHAWNKRNLSQYVGSIPELIRLNGIAMKLKEKEKFKDLSPHLGDAIKTINQVRNRMSIFQINFTSQSNIEVVFFSILETIKIIFLLEPLLLFDILKKLNTRRVQVETVFNFVGEVDSLLSIASLREGLSTYCIPTIDAKHITAVNNYHPLIVDCVKNDISVSDKSILLTGSNMSGKTSFIRSIGINVITGLTMNTCFADSMTIPHCKVYSAIRISDDLMNNKSYYFEEVLTVKEMIDQSKEDCKSLFLLDELFKGTNTIERISAGKAVLSKLIENDNIVLVSTHDIELTEMLQHEYDLYHFSEVVQDKNVDFDFKLKEGKLTNRNAIRILKLNNYPKDLIKEAFEISEKLDRQTLEKSWS